MKKFFKPANIAFSILMLIVFFFIGIYTAGLFGAGDGQMLAGGAIVFFWGLIASIAAFILSFFIPRYVSPKRIVRFNWILFVLLLILYGITHYRYMERQKAQNVEEPVFENQPTQTTEG